MKSTVNYMNPEQFEEVLKAIPDLYLRKWKDSDIRMLFKILYWCGLRINEGIKLTKEDFDFERMEVFLGKTKTHKGDRAVILTAFAPELMEWMATKDEGPLFPGLTYNTMIRWVYKLGKQLNITAWTTRRSESGEMTKSHIFRKSIGKDLLYGTHTGGNKAPISVISKHLRHTGKKGANINTTTEYLKVSGKDVKDWFASVEE